ncbi:phage protein [Salmonella enterica subsp. enterica]|nr:phage protein [Salmonella enterica subsp. enterica serovar Muenster str. 660]SUE58804.1 phage protein [Salmonella enterica]SUH76424.1 phage protein [Salmonella enterica subsp. enterica serovar Panama]VEA30244.1 phage protein [Salmonella enterica subsp. enterica]
MFDYQTSKHAHFNAACRAFAIEHNLEDVAAAVGMKPQILRNKLNPAQPHRLTCNELLAITITPKMRVYWMGCWGKLTAFHPCL